MPACSPLPGAAGSRHDPATLCADHSHQKELEDEKKEAVKKLAKAWDREVKTIVDQVLVLRKANPNVTGRDNFDSETSKFRVSGVMVHGS